MPRDGTPVDKKDLPAGRVRECAITLNKVVVIVCALCKPAWLINLIATTTNKSGHNQIGPQSDVKLRAGI